MDKVYVDSKVASEVLGISEATIRDTITDAINKADDSKGYFMGRKCFVAIDKSQMPIEKKEPTDIDKIKEQISLENSNIELRKAQIESNKLLKDLEASKLCMTAKEFDDRSKDIINREKIVDAKKTEFTDREVALSALEAQVKERNAELLKRVSEFEVSIEARNSACEKQCNDMLGQAKQQVLEAEKRCKEFDESRHIQEAIANKKANAEWEKEQKPKRHWYDL